MSCVGLSSAELTALCVQINTPAVEVECAANQFLDAGSCGNYSSPLDLATAIQGDGATPDTGDTAFMLAAAALVMIMTPGVALFYAGLAGEESAGNTLLMSVSAMCIVTFQWFFFGYSITFSPGSNTIGGGAWVGLIGVAFAPTGAYAATIPHILFAIFQCMFAQITPAIISGSVVGRMKFSSWCIFVLVWTTIVYDPIAHWYWAFTVDEDFAAASNGWLGQLGTLDFAGGSIIHIPSGFAGLAAALILGKRHDHGEPLKPHNTPLIMLGASLLWFGWFGFNAGSWWAVDGPATQAFFNTHIAAAAACGSWMAVEKWHANKITPAGAAAGVVAGLVGITPGCAFVMSYAALLIGLIVSPICYGAMQLVTKLGIDDTLDAFALHGIGGVVGGILTGLFAAPEINGVAGGFYGDGGYHLGINTLGIVVSGVYSFVLTAAILLILKFTIGIRVDESAEKEGIDISEHGGKSYIAKN